MFKESNKYDDIINMPHPVSKTRPRMSNHDRAAQFSPFAALTGYEDMIEETARLTGERIILDEDSLRILDERLSIIRYKNPDSEVRIAYFKPDERKSGGEYVSHRGRIKKFDDITQNIVFRDGKIIPVADILELDIIG